MKSRSDKPVLHQEDLPLSSVASHVLFPGRATLYPWEVARALSMTERQVLDLCEQGEIAGINIGSGPKKSRSGRNYWRIPVSAYDAFIAKRKSL